MKNNFLNNLELFTMFFSKKKSRRNKKFHLRFKNDIKIVILIISSFLLTCAVFVIVVRFEPTEQLPNIAKNSDDKNNSKCETEPFSSWNCFFDKVSKSELLKQVQTMGVLVAAFLYLFDLPDRKKQAERQAWQLIDGARDVETSGARFEALEELNQGGNSLWGLDADGADLIEINLPGADLDSSNLEKALLRGANLQRASLRGANLQEADLRGANLKRADLEGANLQSAKLDRDYNDNSTNLQKAKLCRASLHQAKLCGTNLRGADLRGAVLCEANLRGADLREANLRGAELEGANLRGAKLRGAELEGANLRGAKLCGAELEGAELEGANLREAILEEDGSIPLMNRNQDEPDTPVVERYLGKNRQTSETINLYKLLENKNEISEIIQKITKLLNFIETGNSLSLHDPVVKDLIKTWKSLIAKEESLGRLSPELVEEVTENTENLREHIIEKEQVQNIQDKVKNKEIKDEAEYEPYLLTGQWLRNNLSRVISQALNDENNIKTIKELTVEISISGGQFRQFLELDINKCLIHLCDYLENINTGELAYEKLDLNLPISIYPEVFEIVLKQLNTEILQNKSHKLSNKDRNEVTQILNEFFQDFIKNVKLNC